LGNLCVDKDTSCRACARGSRPHRPPARPPARPPLRSDNEYYQWSPTHNQNSPQKNVKPGDLLFGSITYEPATNSYTVFHNSSSGGSVSMNIPIQKDRAGAFKNYSIAYFVFEKTAPCGDYPPNKIVTFNNVRIEWDGQPQTAAWTEAFVDDVCNFRAHVPTPATDGTGVVTITWDTAAQDADAKRIEASQANKTLAGRVPESVAEIARKHYANQA
jgi:hypothetical protein